MPVVHRLTVRHLPESWRSAHQGGRREDFSLCKTASEEQKVSQSRRLCECTAPRAESSRTVSACLPLIPYLQIAVRQKDGARWLLTLNMMHEDCLNCKSRSGIFISVKAKPASRTSPESSANHLKSAASKIQFMGEGAHETNV